MAAAEIMNELEYYRMKAAELEKAEIVKDKILEVLENTKQEYADVVGFSHDGKARAVAQNKWKALDDIQKEIELLVL